MSTVEQIEAAIRALPARERDRLAKALPKLFPELDGDAAWDRINRDDRPRPALSRLLDEVDAAVAEEPARFPETTDNETATWPDDSQLAGRRSSTRSFRPSAGSAISKPRSVARCTDA